MIEKKMLAKLKQVMPFVMFESIETSTTLGFPDVLYGLGETLGLAELKELNRIPVHKFTVPWRPGQLAWHAKYAKKNESPYRLILTMQDSWYIIPIIKQSYLMVEVQSYYVGQTRDLKNVVDTLLHMLYL